MDPRVCACICSGFTISNFDVSGLATLFFPGGNLVSSAILTYARLVDHTRAQTSDQKLCYDNSAHVTPLQEEWDGDIDGGDEETNDEKIARLGPRPVLYTGSIGTVTLLGPDLATFSCLMASECTVVVTG